MRASQERRIYRWLHILLSIPIVGFIYGPVSQIPPAAFFVRWIAVPAVVLTGFWMWKGKWLKRWLRQHWPAAGRPSGV